MIISPIRLDFIIDFEMRKRKLWFLPLILRLKIDLISSEYPWKYGSFNINSLLTISRFNNPYRILRWFRTNHGEGIRCIERYNQLACACAYNGNWWIIPFNSFHKHINIWPTMSAAQFQCISWVHALPIDILRVRRMINPVLWLRKFKIVLWGLGVSDRKEIRRG